MNLVIDIGNTQLKAGIFEQEEAIGFWDSLSEETLEYLIKKYPIQHALVSTVRKDIMSIQKIITESNITIQFLTSDTPLPIHNQYDTPHTLGVDRLASAVGAKVLFPEKSCLVIDAGTCITYDFVDEEGNFKGGNISPGLQMRFNAVHHFTQKLPLIENYRSTPTTLIGKNTSQAIINGIINGIIYEIEGYIHQYQATYPDFCTILCGGDTVFFETKIKQQIFASPKLTLIGLNRILRYNVEKK